MGASCPCIKDVVEWQLLAHFVYRHWWVEEEAQGLVNTGVYGGTEGFMSRLSGPPHISFVLISPGHPPNSTVPSRGHGVKLHASGQALSDSFF